MKIEIRNDNGVLRGCVQDDDDNRQLLGPVIAQIAVDDSAGYIYPGPDDERINSLCVRAVDAYRAGRTTVVA